MNVNLVPTYFCNFRCHYCYWKEELLGDAHRAAISSIEERLNEIPGTIDLIDIYGGELAILPEEYMYSLLDVVYKRAPKHINIVSNASKMPSWLWAPNLSPGFSWDFKCRQDYKEVFDNMLHFNRHFSINTVVTKCFLKQNIEEVIEHLNRLPNLKCWELKPYSPSLANDLGVTNKEFENLVRKIIENRYLLRPDILFHNEDTQLKNALTGVSNPDILLDNIFILPSGKFGDFGYNSGNHLERFFEFNSFEEWVSWKDQRRETIRKNPFCSKCEYLGKCMSENMREVKDLDKDSCDGFFDLIGWYKKRTTHESVTDH